MIALPLRTKGRPSIAGAAAYRAELQAFASDIEKIASRLEFTISSRGWCYVLEEYGVTKGQFDQTQRILNECRKAGLLPLDICAVDENREADVPSDHADEGDVHAAAERIYADAVGNYENALDDALETLGSATHEPFRFWDFQEFYVEMAVEKIDLRTLFKPICDRFRIPLTNIKGWADLHSRAAMLRRFESHASAGRRCVLLYAGDHDPAGICISESIRGNLRDLIGARFRNGDRINFDADNLIIDRFGLNADFIEEHRLTWIDGLETGSGQNLADPRHRDHSKPYVQDYLAKFGPRKVEANALVVRPQAARELCQSAITRYISLDRERERRIENQRQTEALRTLLARKAQEGGLQ